MDTWELQRICFDALRNHLPYDTINEIVKHVPKCTFCGRHSSSSFTHCNTCGDYYCNNSSCVQTCIDCDESVCDKCGITYYTSGNQFNMHTCTVCKTCERSPCCKVCKLVGIFFLSRCIECYKLYCCECSDACCTNDIICHQCLPTSKKMYTCLACKQVVVCDECSYLCQTCCSPLCHECHEVCLVYNSGDSDSESFCNVCAPHS
jgi:hypothetical protein